MGRYARETRAGPDAKLALTRGQPTRGVGTESVSAREELTLRRRVPLVALSRVGWSRPRSLPAHPLAPDALELTAASLHLKALDREFAPTLDRHSPAPAGRTHEKQLLHGELGAALLAAARNRHPLDPEFGPLNHRPLGDHLETEPERLGHHGTQLTYPEGHGDHAARLVALPFLENYREKTLGDGHLMHGTKTKQGESGQGQAGTDSGRNEGSPLATALLLAAPQLLPDLFKIALVLLPGDGHLAHHVQLHYQKIQLLELQVLLPLIGDPAEQLFCCDDLFLQLQLGREAIGVLQYLVRESEILRDVAVILELQRFPVAGEIVELPTALRLDDSLFGNPPENGEYTISGHPVPLR
jgi:hypothetical protein